MSNQSTLPLIKSFTKDSLDLEIGNLLADLSVITEVENDMVGVTTVYNSVARVQSKSNELYGEFQHADFDFNQPFFEHKKKILRLIHQLINLKVDVPYHKLFSNENLVKCAVEVKDHDFCGESRCFNDFVEIYFEGCNRHSTDLIIDLQGDVVLEGDVNKIAPGFIASLCNLANFANEVEERVVPLPCGLFLSSYEFENDDFQVKFHQNFHVDR